MNLRFLTSMKTTVPLLGLIILFSLPGTILPAGTGWYRSTLYMIPWFLFFLNLCACALKRFLRHFRGEKLPWGADLIHLGLMLMLLWGFASTATRQEWYAEVEPGDILEMEGSGSWQVTELLRRDWPDGSPQEWITVLQPETEAESTDVLRVRVNHPARIGPYRVYQQAFDNSAVPPRSGLLFVRTLPMPPLLAAMTIFLGGFIFLLIEKRTRSRRT